MEFLKVEKINSYEIDNAYELTYVATKEKANFIQLDRYVKDSQSNGDIHLVIFAQNIENNDVFIYTCSLIGWCYVGEKISKKTYERLTKTWNKSEGIFWHEAGLLTCP